MHRWNDTLWLFTPVEFDKLPDGIELKCIDGTFKVKGRDEIDMDTRFGYIAYGVENPTSHPQAELFTVFMLS